MFAFNLLRMSRNESSAVINIESLVVLDLRKWSGSYDGTRFRRTFLIRMNSKLQDSTGRPTQKNSCMTIINNFQRFCNFAKVLPQKQNHIPLTESNPGRTGEQRLCLTLDRTSNYLMLLSHFPGTMTLESLHLFQRKGCWVWVVAP